MWSSLAFVRIEQSCEEIVRNKTYNKSNGKNATMLVYGGALDATGFGPKDTTELVAPDGQIWAVRKEMI